MGRVLFFDIDGTLVGFDKKMPDSARKAVLQAKENGHILILCTGRGECQLYPLLREIGFDGVISSGGTGVTYHDQVVARHAFGTEKMRFLTDLFLKYQIPYLLQAPDYYTIPQEGADGMRAAVSGNVSSPDTDPLSMLAPNMPEGVYFDPSIADHPQDYAGTDRILIGSSPIPVERLREMISPMGLKIEFASFKTPDPYSGEISPEGISKSTGMMELLQFLGRRQEDTVAFGDGPNDLEMMEFSACSVAMGNAIDSVKKRADLVTDDISCDGLFKAMQKLKLI